MNKDTLKKEEIMRFKIVGFEYFPDTENVSDCLAVTEKGEKFLVDPFVGCAWKYENRELLLNTWFEAEGHWHKDETFLPRENKMKVIQK